MAEPLPGRAQAEAEADEQIWRELQGDLAARAPTGSHIGVIWFVFHVPIMFVPNSIAGGQSLETALPFLVIVLAASVLMTWLYRGTGGSVLLPWLFHGAVNAWPRLVGGAGSEARLIWLAAALLALAAAAVVVRRGPDLSWPIADGSRYDCRA
ncbi:MAG: CPBP family intramembrane metalloprotease [Chloroflexales bacterium]|nr:CPBP family intramembrane metalloprotease [Chloroflexales bacterium]